MRIDDPAEIVYAVTAEVATAENVAIKELPPLGDIVDIDALERILRSSDGEVWITFEYCARDITITGDGLLTMSDPTGEHGPYAAYCHTCGENRRGADLDSAQEFFAVHADRRHEVEIVRQERSTPDTSVGAGDDDPEEATGTD